MEIYNASCVLTADAFRTFAKPPLRTVFQPGDRLFRLGTVASRTFKGSDIFGSPWWIPYKTYQQISKSAHRTGSSIIDVARSRLAVAKQWNPKMDWLMLIELTRPVNAWVGPARPQMIDAPDCSVVLLGNFEQAYVPGLAPPDTLVSNAARLMYYGAAET